MRRIVALVVTLIALAIPARAEEATETLLDSVGFDRLEALASETGLPEAGNILKKALSGELCPEADWPERALNKLINRAKTGLTRALTLLAAPVLASLFIRMVLGRNDGALALLCRLAIACGLMERCATAIAETEAAVSAAARMMEAVSPVLAAALALAGPASGAILTPLSALCAGLIEGVLLRFALPACALAAALAASGGMSERFRLDRMFGLLRRGTAWMIGIMLTGFAALLCAQGSLAAAQDLGATRAAGQALLRLVPIVGDALSDSTGALADSAAAVTGAVGVTGAVLAMAACVRRVLPLAAMALSIKLAAAVIEPVADPCVTRLVTRFGDVARMLTAICAASYAMVALLAGTCLGAVI